MFELIYIKGRFNKPLLHGSLPQNNRFIQTIEMKAGAA